MLFGNDTGTPAAGAFTLSQSSGLIGSPARTEDGMKAMMVLNADIELGQTIALQSIQLTGEVQGQDHPAPGRHAGRRMGNRH